MGSRHADASRELARRHEVLAGLVAEHGPMRIPRRTAVDDRFESLARAITFQQLAGRAASTIWGRVRALTDDHLRSTDRPGPRRDRSPRARG